MANSECYHVPVLLNETIQGMNLHDGGIYVDMTFGGGGHSKEILRNMGEKSQLYAFDQDADALANMPHDPRFTFVRSNFRYLRNFMRYYNVDQVDAIIADLGVSWHHFDDPQRGFSFRSDGPLDMRMNKSAKVTAADVVNNYKEQDLFKTFREYGELRESRRLAQTIVKARQQRPILTIKDFLDTIRGVFPPEREKKELPKVFQALRIEVNQEMQALQEMLLAAAKIIKIGGRLAVISYHSLEDRIVKNIMRAGNAEGNAQTDFYGNLISPFSFVAGKVITPSQEEQIQNPRARSAKLRIAQKTE